MSRMPNNLLLCYTMRSQLLFRSLYISWKLHLIHLILLLLGVLLLSRDIWLFRWLLVCSLFPRVVIVFFMGLFLGVFVVLMLLLLFEFAFLELFELFYGLFILPIISSWLKLCRSKFFHFFLTLTILLLSLLFFLLWLIISLNLRLNLLLP